MFFELNYTHLLLLIPVYCWFTNYKSHKQLKHETEQRALFNKRHNCVVMYLKGKGMSGWPGYPERVKLSIDSLQLFSDPIVYYINTAEKSIDIAVMLITTKSIMDALLAALNRRVAIRMIVNHEHMKEDRNLKNLKRCGGEIMYFIGYDVESIMHYKYAVKDYESGRGFVVNGSMNWTQTGLIDNYEDLVFTSSNKVAKAMHDDFEETWAILQQEKNTNEVVKFTLGDL